MTAETTHSTAAPGSVPPTCSPAVLRESYRFCDRLARREARNFYCSFLLLPPDRRRSMSALYAYMRHSDDLADEPGEASAKFEALDGWGADVRRAIQGGLDSGWPGLPAIADTVRRRGIPARLLDEVLEGVRMDVVPATFPTFDDLYRYCYLVASTVGLCCLHVWGYRSEGGAAERLAQSTGLALQLTNIIRDVREDALAGRIYLPKEDMTRFGVAPENLQERETGPALRRLLEFEAARAYDYYREGEGLLPLVEPQGRPVLRTITGIYRALLDEVRRRNYDVLPARVRVPGWKKASIAARAIVGR